MLEALDDIVIDGARPGRRSIDVLTDSDLVARLEADPFAPPDLDDADPAEIANSWRGGARAGRRCRLRASAIDEAAGWWLGCWLTSPMESPSRGPRCVGHHAQVRNPVDHRLDETGVTRRRGDLRIAGAPPQG